MTWPGACDQPKESNRSLVIDWSRCPAGLRPGMMRAAFAELNIPTRAVLCSQQRPRAPPPNRAPCAQLPDLDPLC
ncbi:hypothetical protein E4K10_47820 [Streptomyces sp. T1317-0309]|nr:hypothetical protein E4K10_47820 [Streptomyces sp. T1317-0309]